MVGTSHPLKEREPYIIYLPDQIHHPVPQYSRIPRVGITRAFSPAHAITQYVFRHIKDPTAARTICCDLLGPLGDENPYAYTFPEIESEDGSLKEDDRRYLQELTLAKEMASKHKELDPVDKAIAYLPHARYLLEAVCGSEGHSVASGRRAIA